MWTTKIKRIDYDPLPDQLFRFHIDSPKQNDLFDNKSVLISGWILGAKEPIDHIQITSKNVTSKAPVTRFRPDVAQKYDQHPSAEQSGFHHHFPFEPASGKVKLIISVKIGPDMIRIGRVILQTEFSGISMQPKFTPIMVTSLGRTGTTLSLSALGNHPEIAITRIHPFETNVAQELMQHLLDCLPLNKISNLPLPLKRSVQNEYEEKTIRHFVNSIDHFYEAIARENKQQHAHYFAEKFLPSNLQNWFYELYPGTKEIFLVRDFRDVICSILSFNRKRGFDDFQRQNYESDLEFIRNFGGPNALLNTWNARKDSALLVRYEDLIRAARKTWTGIFEYLDIDTNPKLVDRISGLGEKSTMAFRKHSTSASRQESIGRWQRDLPFQLVEAANQAFDKALIGFGYDL